MATVAIVGAGDIGGACAHALAAHDLRRSHSCDRSPLRMPAAGKALDIQQSGAISGFHARLEATERRVTRDRMRSVRRLPTALRRAHPSGRAKKGFAMIKRDGEPRPTLPVVFAGARQADLIRASSQEARIACAPPDWASGPRRLPSAVAAIVAMEARCAPNEVSVADARHASCVRSLFHGATRRSAGYALERVDLAGAASADRGARRAPLAAGTLRARRRRCTRCRSACCMIVAAVV